MNTNMLTKNNASKISIKIKYTYISTVLKNVVLILSLNNCRLIQKENIKYNHQGSESSGSFDKGRSNIETINIWHAA